MADLEIDDQVAEIADDMLADRWRAGSSHAEKAERWGISIGLVRKRSAEAARLNRIRYPELPADVLDECMRDARRIGSRAEDAGDHRNALAGVELRLRVHGLLDPQPTELMTDDERHALIVALGYRKDPDATEPGTPTATARGSADSGGEQAEEKGRAEGFSDDD